MRHSLKPMTRSGKWSVGLHTFFLIMVITSILLVNGLHILSYNNRWWDVTVAVIFPASFTAFITGIIAAIKGKDRSVLVLLSIFLGVCVILFLLLHSLFIHD